jgi:peptidyl-prolyl cis-trans isomerase D
LPPNQPSQPIKSPLGWHILRVTKIVPATAQSFEQAKPKLENDLKMQAAVDRLDKIGNEADDALAGGAALADVARKYGLKLTRVAAIDEGGKDRDGKPVKLAVAPDEVLKTVFGTDNGDTSRVTDTKDGAIFAVHVDRIVPPQTRPLAEVKDQVVADWQAEQKRAAAAKEAKALAAAVSPGTPLAKAAGAASAASDKGGLTLLKAVALSRTPQPGQSVPPALVARLFAAAQPGAVVTVTDDATGAYVAQLDEIQSPKTVPPAAATALSQQLADDAKLTVANEYTAGLRARFPVEIDHDALARMF